MKEVSAGELGEEALILVKAASEASKQAYAPYSKFQVGAAARLTDGTILTGVNYECASYGLTLCAERSLITSAQVKGCAEKITTIAVIAQSEEHSTEFPLTPCGACRQWIVELSQRTESSLKIICSNGDLSRFLVLTADELLPGSFSL